MQQPDTATSTQALNAAANLPAIQPVADDGASPKVDRARTKEDERAYHSAALTVGGTAAYIGVSVPTVWRKIADGSLIAHKCGRRVLILRVNADRFLQALPQWEGRAA